MLSTGQVNDAFLQALGRPPTGEELRKYTSRTDLEGSPGQAVIISELSGGGGKAGGSTGTMADQLIKASTDAYNKQWEDYKSKSKQFDAANPFNFDKMLETTTAEVATRLDPYYKQTLTDFLTGVTTQRNRTNEDRSQLLTELNQDVTSYTGQAKMALDKAIENSREGFADAGLYNSGAQLRGEGTTKTAGNLSMADYLRGVESKTTNINKGATRTLEDLALNETQKRRDLLQEQKYQTTSQALTEAQRRQQQREYEKAQFTGVPPGVSAAQYNTYTGSLLA